MPERSVRLLLPLLPLRLPHPWGALRLLSVAAVVGLGSTTGLLAGCQTPQSGVKTAFGSQFAIVNASVAETTEAAAAVLEQLAISEITATSTEIDSEVTGFLPDRTRVEVYAAREAEGRTEVSVNVGALGETDTGARIVSMIRERLGS